MRAAGCVGLLALWVGAAGCRSDVLDLGDIRASVEEGEALLGGATTVEDTGRNSFGRSPMNLDPARWPSFYVGKGVFERDWSEPRFAPIPVGPLFSASSCMTCHVKDGRGRPPAEATERPVSLVFQLSAPMGALPHERYGGQLDSRAVEGQAAEGWVAVTWDTRSGAFATGESYSLTSPRYRFMDMAQGALEEGTRFSPRVAPANPGLGLLEAIPEETLLARADPDDADGDGISGRPNWVEDVTEHRARLGRFGWKANQPTLRQQVAHALLADMGMTTTLYPREQGHRDGVDAEGPEVSAEDLERLLFYTRLLAVPRRRDEGAPNVLRGKAVFRALRCSGCHVDTPVMTGDVDGFPEVSRQSIRPFTDLLLHDMGEGLADGRPDGEASGSEWRTPPLWGIGLTEAVSGHTRFLHDGRARTLEEAVLWHGGEAAKSRDMYVRLSREDRSALLAFLGSL
ncbi:thiol oxidoreductase [Corallococcus sp. H22C18031201]|nr:thiol oxidoreductase [Corallococcus sp. H22C18031201]